MVDGVIIIGRVKTSRREAINRVRTLLTTVGRAHVLGVVANDVAVTRRSYMYGYGSPQPAASEGSESLVTTDSRS
jgi:hypothetical protein